MSEYLTLLKIVGTLLGVMTSLSSASAQTYVSKQILDPESQNAAVTYRLPQGWTSTDRVFWNRGIRVNPMSFSINATSQDQEMLVSYVSGLSYDFVSTPYGLLAGRAAPPSPSDFLLLNFITVHPNTQYQIVDKQDTPIAYPYKPAVSSVVTHAYNSEMRIRFMNNGVDSIEKLAMNYYSYTQPIGNNRTKGNWFVDGLTVLVTPSDELGAMGDMRQNILGTAKLTTSFMAKYQAVSANLLAKTRAETEGLKHRKPQRVVVIHDGGGYYGGRRAMDKDCFILHEELRSVRTRIFNYAMGN